MKYNHIGIPAAQHFAGEMPLRHLKNDGQLPATSPRFACGHFESIGA
jgi:hypothetical protein